MFGDFAVSGEVVEEFVELGEGDADGDEVDFGFGLLDELDEVVAVAVHGDEFAAALAGFEFESFGGATAVDVFAIDETAGFLVDDFTTEGLGDGFVIVAVVGEHGFDFLGGSGGVGVDFLLDSGFDETEVEHALVFGFVETEIVADDLKKGFFAAVDTADSQVTVEFFGNVVVGDGDVLFLGELDGVGVGFGVGEGGAFVFIAQVLDGGLVELTAGLAFDGSHATAIEENVVGKEDWLGIDGGDGNGDNFGDAKEEIIGHVEPVESEPAANNNNGNHNDRNQDGVNHDAVLGPLEGIFEFATLREDLLAAFVDLFLLGLDDFFFLEHSYIITLND